MDSPSSVNIIKDKAGEGKLTPLQLEPLASSKSRKNGGDVPVAEARIASDVRIHTDSASGSASAATNNPSHEDNGIELQANSGSEAKSEQKKDVKNERRASLLDAEGTESFTFNFFDDVGNDAKGFPTNAIRTSKYTWWNFICKNLAEQFRRLANAYFLLIVCIQAIPGVSPFPIYTSILPLMFILGVSALKEALEDYRRHKEDNRANGTEYKVIEADGSIRIAESKDLKTGQFLQILEGEEFPADLIFFSSTNSENTCYVNTANLDGEAVPKVRVAPSCTMEYDTPDKLSNINGNLQCEAANSSLYQYNGVCSLTDPSTSAVKSYPIAEKQLLLRGSKLVNPASVIGVIAYTGDQTKMMLNRNPARDKFSSFEKMLNKFVIVMFFFNLSCCFLLGILNATVNTEFAEFYDIDNEGAFGFIKGVLTQYILFSFMIPMSLYVTVELVKVGQAKFMEWDSKMGWTDPDTGEYHRMHVKTSNLNEELGNIDYIFTDKTGTLTQNRMELTQCSVAGVTFYDEANASPALFADPQPRMSLVNSGSGGVVDVQKGNNNITSPNLRDLPNRPSSFRAGVGSLHPNKGNKTDKARDQLSLSIQNSSGGGSSSSAPSSFIANSGTGSARPSLKGRLTEASMFDLAFKAFGSDNDATDSKHLGPFVNKSDLGIQTNTNKSNNHHHDSKNGDHNHDGPNGKQRLDEKKHDDFALNPWREFLYTLCFNNEVLPKKLDDDTYEFQSQSPDEIAFAEAIDRCGLRLTQRAGKVLHFSEPVYDSAGLQVGSNPKQVEIKAMLEFASSRLRMSVVVQEKDTGKYKLYVKGADSKVFEFIDSKSGKQHKLVESTGADVKRFARQGSRTLVMAGRELSAKEFEDWYENHFHKAETSMKNREELIEKAFLRIESELTLLGCTAVDDHLQESVPEVIDFILAANIKVIVLTGDIKETAVTIAKDSHLIQPSVECLYVSGFTSEEVETSLMKAYEKMKLGLSSTHVNGQQVDIDNNNDSNDDKDGNNSSKKFAMIINGFTLQVCLRKFNDTFLEIFQHCETVVSYRSTPKQKALVVKLVKDNEDKVCLAIGDGANDVSMIQEAHVGIGIRGKEGAHAANSSDYVIYRFKHLKRLIFVHGRYSLYRTALVVFFSFYKNLAFPLPQFWFSFSSAYSGQILYEPWFMSCFNLFFTSLPPLFVGWLERDIHERLCLTIPIAYDFFKSQSIYNLKNFILWMAIAIYHSIVAYFFMYGLWSSSGGIIHSDGKSNGIMTMGNSIFHAIILIINIKMLICCKWIQAFSIISFSLGVLAFYLIWIILSFINWSSFAPFSYGVMERTMDSDVMHMYILLVLVLALLPYFAYSSYMSMYQPTFADQLTSHEVIDFCEDEVLKPAEVSDEIDMLRSQAEEDDTKKNEKNNNEDTNYDRSNNNQSQGSPEARESALGETIASV